MKLDSVQTYQEGSFDIDQRHITGSKSLVDVVEFGDISNPDSGDLQILIEGVPEYGVDRHSWFNSDIRRQICRSILDVYTYTKLSAFMQLAGVPQHEGQRIMDASVARELDPGVDPRLVLMGIQTYDPTTQRSDTLHPSFTQWNNKVQLMLTQLDGETKYHRYTWANTTGRSIANWFSFGLYGRFRPSKNEEVKAKKRLIEQLTHAQELYAGQADTSADYARDRIFSANIHVRAREYAFDIENPNDLPMLVTDATIEQANLLVLNYRDTTSEDANSVQEPRKIRA